MVFSVTLYVNAVFIMGIRNAWLIQDFWLDIHSIAKSHFVVILTLRPVSPIDPMQTLNKVEDSPLLTNVSESSNMT